MSKVVASRKLSFFVFYRKKDCQYYQSNVLSINPYSNFVEFYASQCDSIYIADPNIGYDPENLICFMTIII